MHDICTIRVTEHCFYSNVVTVYNSIYSYRSRTPCAYLGDKITFKFGTEERVFIVKRHSYFTHSIIRAYDLNTQSSLSHRRYEEIKFLYKRDIFEQVKSVQTYIGKDNSIILPIFKLSKPGVDISPKLFYFQVRTLLQ